ncbi:OLC1v1037926C1 [Oldenlandia corymbosa var. corymbosa]|uniref:OLC1v1037926C1 n=1 Tax=Oldenlandia corymbosa var. corymbosa TaxID=529605 RepID=A0AAV1CYK4_OLDCO|nr:OLC1v1037926C1 [Oldenlandia corymbosa var. corymbosa]
MATTSKIVAKLDLKPHPEGGFYSETLRDNSVILSKSQLPPQYKVDRPISTCIYFLLPTGSVSHLHRIPCAETWHFYAGEPLSVVELNEDGSVKITCLGPDPVADNQQVQYTVPPNVWFGSFPTYDIDISSDIKAVKKPARNGENHFSLVGCTCAPGFQFEDFELAKRSELISRFPAYESLITLLTFPE